ncbi:hypothetical protein ACIO3O_03580 [Streptomyces sp. NPDC087440]|uniref:hypothetical protein n=1 Tax=Streptomyces sp. NPDC087440 TaxID=3365790 RepID=UPI00381D7F52
MTSQHSGGGTGREASDTSRVCEVFGKAVAAYAREDFAASVGYLRLLDRDGPVPARLAAAHAALHGALAARVRNWGRCCDWYLRSLAAHDVPFAARVSGACSVAECGGAAASRCGQCGGDHCSAHGVRHGDGVRRCVPCLNTALTNIAQAALLTGRTEEAVRVLRSWSREDDPSAARELLKSLAPADPSETDALVDAYRAYGTRIVVDLPSHRVSRRHVSTLALHHALGRGGHAEWHRVNRPTARDMDGHADELYVQSAAHTARGLTASGDHAQAWGRWAAIWRSRPLDLRATHALGVAALRLATSAVPLAERDRVAVTRQIIVCWAVVLHSPAFRSAVRDACGEEFEDEVWASAVDSLRTQITQLLQDGDRTRGNTRARSLELKWRMECEAASRWAALPPTDAPAPPGPGLFCGPLYLVEVASITASWRRRMREVRERIPPAAASGAPGASALAELFGPEPVLATLLREGRWQDVITAVEESYPDWRGRAARSGSGLAGGASLDRTGSDDGDSGGPAAVAMLGTAFLRRAEEYVRGKRWPEALRNFELARDAGQDMARYAGQVCRAAVGAGATVRGRFTGDHAQAGFLERGLQLAPGQVELARNLTAVSLRLAEQAEKRGNREEAERRYRRAQELSPDDRQAADGLARVVRPVVRPSAAPASVPPLPPPPPPSPASASTPGDGGRKGDVPPADRPDTWQLAVAMHAKSLTLARKGDRDKALTLMRRAATLLAGYPDRRFSGESAEVDVARGLWRRGHAHSTRDEAGTRARIDLLRLSLSYHRLPENTELPELLYLLAASLLGARAYDKIIELSERCTGEEGDLTDFHEVLALAYDLRGARHHRAGDQRASTQDFHAAWRLRNAAGKAGETGKAGESGAKEQQAAQEETSGVGSGSPPVAPPAAGAPPVAPPAAAPPSADTPPTTPPEGT